uniref:Beta-flanking protein n=1 Tax=Auricularia cornea TaxID=1238391 RepID=A0A8K2AUU4_9AGAM|nr:beta-flanking protein [Auricularia cornea]
MDSPVEPTTSLLLPPSELPVAAQPLPALMPYVRSLPQDHTPRFSDLKHDSALADTDASVRVAFGLLALLYLICEPEAALPRFASPWDEWQERTRRQTRHETLQQAVLSYWREFEEDEGEKDIEEVLWTEFLLDGDSNKVLRGEWATLAKPTRANFADTETHVRPVVDFLDNPRVPQALLCQGPIEFALLRSWEHGVPARCRVVESTEPPILQRYDSFTTPRVAHAITLGIQVFYIYLVAHYVLWPNVITIYAGDATEGDIDYISSPREVLIVLFSLSAVLGLPARRQSFASLLTFLSFLFSFPDTPKPKTTPFSLLLLSLILHTFDLHFSLPTPALLMNPPFILPLLTLYRLLLSRVMRPAFYFCAPVILGACIMLSTSLDDIQLIGKPMFSVFNLASAPEETRLASLMILGLGIALFFYLVHGVASVFPMALPGKPPASSPWDAYDRAIGLAARRSFITTLLRYSEPYFFPPTIRLVVVVCVSTPVAVIRMLGKPDMALHVRDGVQSLLWRALIGPAGFIIAGFWRWRRYHGTRAQTRSTGCCSGLSSAERRDARLSMQMIAEAVNDVALNWATPRRSSKAARPGTERFCFLPQPPQPWCASPACPGCKWGPLTAALGQDNFVNLAKQGLDAYSKSHDNVNQTASHGQSGSDVRKTGGEEYNRRDGTPEPDIDDDDAVSHANQQAGSSGDSSLFAQALSFAKSNRGEHKQPVDEASVVGAHKAAYQDNNASGLDASSMGSAAALQVLKMFTSGGGGDAKSSGKSQSQFIAMAMSEASKLFDKSGGAASGDKVSSFRWSHGRFVEMYAALQQDAVNGAAMTVVKLLVQSKFGGGTVGGENSGGIGALGSLLGGGGGGSNQLLGMAAKFL